jgi:hypothetical protein
MRADIMAARTQFGVPPGFFAQEPSQSLSPNEIAQRLLAQHPPTVLLQQYCEVPAIQRNIAALYVLYQQWMAENQHQLIQQMADGCLLSHFSDSLLLRGGWQNNRECLAILWREDVQFKGNWVGDKTPVLEFWEPPCATAAPAAPTEESKEFSGPVKAEPLNNATINSTSSELD